MTENKYIRESHEWDKEYCDDVIRYYKEHNESWLAHLDKEKVFLEY